MSAQIEIAQASPLPHRLRDAIVSEAIRASAAIVAGKPVERTALLISPTGTWRLPLPPSDDPNVATPMTWAMAFVLATEFVLTIPDLKDAAGGPAGVIGLSRSVDAGLCIPPGVTDGGDNCSRFRLDDATRDAMRAWLPKKYQTLSADDAVCLHEAFGPGGPLELTLESVPEIELSMRAH